MCRQVQGLVSKPEQPKGTVHVSMPTRACAVVSLLPLSYILQGDFCSHDCFRFCLAKSLLHSFPLNFSPHVAPLRWWVILQVYDVIAGHFSSTRFAVWPKVRAFLESLSPGSVVADVGCGNGKYLGVRPDLAVLGCDRSAGEELMSVARLHGLLRSAHGCACVRAGQHSCARVFLVHGCAYGPVRYHASSLLSQ